MRTGLALPRRNTFTMPVITVLFFGITLSGAAVALLLAVGQLLVPGSNRGNRVLSHLYGLCGFVLLISALFTLPGAVAAFPHLDIFGTALLWLIGPVLYLFLKEVLLDMPMRRSLFHFGPPITMAVVSLVFTLYDLTVSVGGAELMQLPVWWGENGYRDLWFYDLLKIFANICLLAYFMPLLVMAVHIRPDLASGYKVVRVTAAVLTAAAGGVVCNLLYAITGHPLFFGGGSLILTGIVFAVFLLSYTYPEVLYIMQIQAFEHSRTGSPLKGVDTDKLFQRLKQLMEKDKIYRDENLQVLAVAAELEIKPHQLTYLLNHIHGMNFAQFINDYRLEEAGRLLVSEPKRSVLDIGFAAGFNSKTAFYRSFQAKTGQTPNEYRKARLSSGG